MQIRINSDNLLCAVYATKEDAATHTFQPGQVGFAFITFEGECPQAFEYVETLPLAHDPGSVSVNLTVYGDRYLLVISCILGNNMNEAFDFILSEASLHLEMCHMQERYMLYDDVIESALQQVSEHVTGYDDSKEWIDDEQAVEKGLLPTSVVLPGQQLES